MIDPEQVRLLRPKRGDVLALYVDIFTIPNPEELARQLAEIRRDGVHVLLLPVGSSLQAAPGRPQSEIINEWLRQYGFRAVPLG